MLKKLEQKGLITRSRCKGDERCLDVCLTDKGEALKEKAVEVPGKIAPCLALTPEEAGTLYSLLRKTLAAMGE